jgi:hypothetical protein
MKNKLVLYFFLAAAGALGAKDHHSVRIPKPDIEAAISLVKKHHEKQTGERKNIFVDEAVFVREPEKAFWRIGVRNSDHERK